MELTLKTKFKDFIKSLILKEKAWSININLLNCPWKYDEMIVHAKSTTEAKVLMMSKFNNELSNALLESTRKNINYLNIPIIRLPGHDKYVYDGATVYLMKLEEIFNMELHKLNIDKILNDDSIKFVYIKKNNSYYGPGNCGYVPTYNWMDAGVYAKEVGALEARRIMEITLVPINIEQYNKTINSLIENLKKKIL